MGDVSLLEHVRTGKPVTRRDGRAVRIHNDDYTTEYPIFGEYHGDNGEWYFASWQGDGRFVNFQSKYDLIPA
jgi:hypothetical protein